MQQYKDDLLSSCLQLVLSIPTEMVNTELDTLMPTVEVHVQYMQCYMQFIMSESMCTWLDRIRIVYIHVCIWIKQALKLILLNTDFLYSTVL